MINLDLFLTSLLGRHVQRSTDEVAADCQRLLPFESRETEVEDSQAAVPVEDQVRRLDVAVGDTL